MATRKSLFYLLALGLALAIISVSHVLGVELNSAAPPFRIKAGDGQELTLAMLQGKVVTLFYETREVVEKNRPLKTTLKELYLAQPEGLKQEWARIPLIDCSSAAWPISQIWQYKLKENSKKEGIAIYGDWDGKVRSDYGMQPNETNVVIIDRAGKIRYQAAGGIVPDEMQRIVDLVKTLLQER